MRSRKRNEPDKPEPDPDAEEDLAEDGGELYDAEATEDYEPGDEYDDFEESDEDTGPVLVDGGLVEDEPDEDSPDEPSPDEEAEPDADEPDPGEPTGAPGRSIADRATATWASLREQARRIELPGSPEGTRNRVLVVAAIALASLAVGFGAYLLGKGSGTDVERARLEGRAAGAQAGAIAGVSSGYPAGFARGRQKAFRDAYVPAYRLYFKRAFEQAGLDPPTNEQIEVPLPGPPP
jgi:hypothetical protein